MATHSEAMLEAYAACPPGEQTIVSLELEHPTFDQPIYIVTDVGDDMQIGIESGSDVNQGEMVNHIACPFRYTYPEQKEGQAAQCRISIDNVNRELMPKIKAAMAVRAAVLVSYREYLSSDLTVPAYGPVQFMLFKVSVKGATLTGTIMVGNYQNKRFPRGDQNYTTTRFRSLLPG